MSTTLKKTNFGSLLPALPGQDFLERWGFGDMPAVPVEREVGYNTTINHLQARANGIVQTVAWLSDVTQHRERLAVTANGQIAFTLANVPINAASVHLIINGATYELITPNASFTLSGTAVTWTGPFNLATTDDVFVAYV